MHHQGKTTVLPFVFRGTKARLGYNEKPPTDLPVLI
jgi:hypothetical protein